MSRRQAAEALVMRRMSASIAATAVITAVRAATRPRIATQRTKAKSPQTNGIVERFHKTMLDEFYRIAFRKKIYATIEDLQADLDLWMRQFNEARPHQGKWCFGKTPLQTFLDALPLAKEKSIQVDGDDRHAAA
jgi:hypothetical protein